MTQNVNCEVFGLDRFGLVSPPYPDLETIRNGACKHAPYFTDTRVGSYRRAFAGDRPGTPSFPQVRDSRGACHEIPALLRSAAQGRARDPGRSRQLVTPGDGRNAALKHSAT